MRIGIAWDIEDPRIKAELFKDLLALQEESGGKTLVDFLIVPPKWALDVVNATACSYAKGCNPTTWRVYVVKEDPELPDYVEDIVKKKIGSDNANHTMSTHTEHYPSLIRQSDHRMVPPGLSINVNKPPPARPGPGSPASLPPSYYYEPFI